MPFTSMPNLCRAVGLVAAAVLCLDTSSAGERFAETGETLTKSCTSDSPIYCAGYIAGVADLANVFYHYTEDKRLHICVEGSKSMRDVARDVASYISARTVQQPITASTEVFNALKTLYPCR